MRHALAVLAFFFATCAAAKAQATSPISNLPLASPSPGDVLAGVHGGTLGVGGTTSKFLVSSLRAGITQQYGEFHLADYGGCVTPSSTDVTTQVQNTINAAVAYANASTAGVFNSAIVNLDGCSPHISSSLTISPSWGNVRVTSNGSGYLTLLPSFPATDDVFLAPASSTINVNLQFDHFNIWTTNGVALTSGALFDLQTCDACNIDTVRVDGYGTWYDFLDLGHDNATAATSGTITARNVTAGGQTGATLRLNGPAGFNLSDSFFLGNSSTASALQANDSAFYHAVDWGTNYITNVDWEGLGYGAVVNIGHQASFFEDLWMTNVICDEAHTGPCFSATLTGTATMRNVFLTTPYFDLYTATGPVVLLSPGSTANLYNFVISGGGFLANGTNGVTVGQYATQVRIGNVGIWDNSNCGVSDGGTATSVIGSQIGHLTSGSSAGNTYGICETATAVNPTYIGNDLQGNTSNAFLETSGATGGLIASNNMTGYSTPAYIVDFKQTIVGNSMGNSGNAGVVNLFSAGNSDTPGALEIGATTGTVTTIGTNASATVAGIAGNALTIKNGGSNLFALNANNGNVGLFANLSLGGSTITLNGAGGPTYAIGSGAPTGACVAGSMYSRTDSGASAGAQVYACRNVSGTGTWEALSGG